MSILTVAGLAPESILRLESKKKGEKAAGTDMVGNPKFNLTSGKIYGYKGAEVAVKGNRFRVKYNSKEYSGAVHDYDGGDWNGKPINVKSYSRLIIVVEGKAPNTKFELNDTVVFDYGKLKTGVNVVDLAAKKKDDFDPLKEIKKINFVNKAGQGKYIIRIRIK
ncbi:hypothetical protein ACFL52_02985 [Candidatus Margulisiibacteriota bacterium]